jgi:hypothetical protein
VLFLLYFPMAAIGYGVLGSEAGSNIIYSLAPGPAKVKRTRIALIKKKIKFPSYVRKFRVEQLQSYI